MIRVILPAWELGSYENGIDRATFIQRADSAMYKAKHKRRGRNCVELFSHSPQKIIKISIFQK